MNERDLGRALLDELAQVVGSLTGGEASQGAGNPPAGQQWTLTVAAEGALRAACVIAIDHESGVALATAVSGQSDDAAIETVLRDAVSKALAAVLAREQAAGIQLTIRAVAKADAAPSGTAHASGVITTGNLNDPMQVGYYAVLAPTVTGGKAKQSKAAHSDQQARLDVILDIDLPVVVRFGRTEMPLRAVTRLGPGSVIDLGRSPDDPVELLVSDRVVARGEVVVVGGNYGIRIVDVASPSERMRSMEA